MSNIVDRYEKLRLREYQLRGYYYPFVCKELSLILRGAFTKVPKNLQSLMFQDTLAAFRFLPQVQTRSGMEGANLLLQAAEFALPKHKRVLAVTEFKHAVVANKRHHKAQKDVNSLVVDDIFPGSASLPHDVLVHIFSLLDARSLVAVGLVCWSWNISASDNRLWQSQYEIFFGCSNICSKNKRQICETKQKSVPFSNKKDEKDLVTVDWREAFKQTYIGNSSLRFSSNRGYCGICKSVVWLSNMKCSNVHHGANIANQQLKSVSPQQLVEYLLWGTFETDSSSDTDSDSDEGSSFKLWAYAEI